MKRIAQCFAALLLASSFSAVSFAQTFTADLVIINANMHIMDAKRTVAHSVAISGGKIVAIGSDADTKPLNR